MIRFSFVLLLSILGLSFSCTGQDQAEQTAQTPTDQVQVIDFHTTHRCKTCVKIEKNTHALLKEAFAEELASGKLTFKVVNIDKPENEDIATRFQAGGTALYLNRIEEGQEHHTDLTDFAFMKAFDEKAFNKTLKAKVEAQLRKL